MRYLDGVTDEEDGDDAVDAALHGIKALAEHPGARRLMAEILAGQGPRSSMPQAGHVRLPAPAAPSRSLAEMLPEALGSIEAMGAGGITGVPTGFA
ncbi:MAG: hypothetical protein ABSB59_11800, partial [Streptosporangiaceae bacterium]